MRKPIHSSEPSPICPHCAYDNMLNDVMSADISDVYQDEEFDIKCIECGGFFTVRINISFDSDISES